MRLFQLFITGFFVTIFSALNAFLAVISSSTAKTYTSHQSRCRHAHQPYAYQADYVHSDSRLLLALPSLALLASFSSRQCGLPHKLRPQPCRLSLLWNNLPHSTFNAILSKTLLIIMSVSNQHTPDTIL